MRNQDGNWVIRTKREAEWKVPEFHDWLEHLRASRLASRYDVLLFEPWPPSPLCDILPRLSVPSRMSPYTSSRGLSYGFFAGPSPVDLLVIAGSLPEMSDRT